MPAISSQQETNRTEVAAAACQPCPVGPLFRFVCCRQSKVWVQVGSSCMKGRRSGEEEYSERSQVGQQREIMGMIIITTSQSHAEFRLPNQVSPAILGPDNDGL